MSDPGSEANANTDTVDTNTEAQTNVDNATEEGGEGGGDNQPSEAETRARRMGWHPKDEYEASGRDASKWVDAETFIKRGEESLPVLKERLRKLDGIIANQDKKLDEGNKLLRDLVKSQTEREKKAVEKAITALKAERREAARVGDDERVEAISNEISEQEEVLRAAPEPPKEEKQRVETEPPPEIDAWVKANPWFEKDAIARNAAIAAYGAYASDTSLTEVQRLAKVRSEIAKRFPEHFSNPNRQRPAAVEAGGRQPRTNGKGWDDIPAADRALAERLIRQGAVKDKASYAKDYFGQSAA